MILWEHLFLVQSAGVGARTALGKFPFGRDGRLPGGGGGLLPGGGGGGSAASLLMSAEHPYRRYSLA